MLSAAIDVCCLVCAAVKMAGQHPLVADRAHRWCWFLCGGVFVSGVLCSSEVDSTAVVLRCSAASQLSRLYAIDQQS